MTISTACTYTPIMKIQGSQPPVFQQNPTYEYVTLSTAKNGLRQFPPPDSGQRLDFVPTPATAFHTTIAPVIVQPLQVTPLCSPPPKGVPAAAHEAHSRLIFLDERKVCIGPSPGHQGKLQKPRSALATDVYVRRQPKNVCCSLCSWVATTVYPIPVLKDKRPRRRLAPYC